MDTYMILYATKWPYHYWNNALVPAPPFVLRLRQFFRGTNASFGVCRAIYGARYGHMMLYMVPKLLQNWPLVPVALLLLYFFPVTIYIYIIYIYTVECIIRSAPSIFLSGRYHRMINLLTLWAFGSSDKSASCSYTRVVKGIHAVQHKVYNLGCC